jgi:hypothetical protein
MNPTIDSEILRKLIRHYKDEPEYLQAILDCLKSFEDYHSAIYKMETHMSLYSGDFEDLDAMRTSCHNEVIANVGQLNRYAEQAGLGPVYTGKIDKARPFRTQLAHAVLAYVEEVVKNRVTGQ